MAKKSTIDVKILGDNKGLSSSLNDSESKIGKFADNASKLATGAALSVGGAVVVALGKGFTDALGAQDNNAMIAAQLGVTPQAAAAIGEAASGAYRDAWGSSLAEVSATAVAITQGFTGPTGASLETLTGQAQALAQAFGVDVSAAVQTASELVSGGLVSDAESAFDLLTTGLQQMPSAVRGELLEASNEYGTFFSALGLSGNEAFGILVEGAQNGVYGIDKAGDAIKEFTIRSTDLSATSEEAYKSIGLNSQEMANQILAGGDTARGAFDQIIGGLLAIDDPAERAKSAIALFGTPLEDLGVNEIPDFLAALQTGAGGMGDFEGAADRMAETVGGTTSSKLESFKRRALGGIADFAANNLLPPFESFLKWSEDNWPKIRQAAEDAFEKVRDGWEKYGETVFDALVEIGQDVVEFFRQNWPKVQDAISETFDWIRDNKDVVIGALVGIGVAVASILVPAFIAWAGAAAAAAAATLIAAAPFIAVGAALAAIGAAAVWAYQNVGWFRDAVDAVASFFVDTVWPILQQTAEVVMSVVGGIVEFVRENWDTIQEIIVTVFTYVRDFVTDIWDAVWEIVSGAIEAIRGVIDVVTGLIKGDWSLVWEGIKSIFTGVWDTIKGVVDLAMAYVGRVIGIGIDAIKLAWETVWGGVSSFVSDVWDDITGFVSDGVGDIVDFVTDLPEDIADAVTGAFDAIWDSFKGVLNKIIDAWNDLGFTLPTVSVDWNGPLPGGKVDVGGWTISTPDLPRFHSGGVVPGPVGSEMLALLEAGERIIPREQVSSDRPIVLVIEGRPFTAMIAEHEQTQVSELLAGVR